MRYFVFSIIYHFVVRNWLIVVNTAHKIRDLVDSALGSSMFGHHGTGFAIDRVATYA